MLTAERPLEKFVSHQKAVATFTALVAAATKISTDAIKSVNMGRLEAIFEIGFARGKLFVVKLPDIGAGSRVRWAPNYEFHSDELIDVTKIPPSDVLDLIFHPTSPS